MPPRHDPPRAKTAFLPASTVRMPSPVLAPVRTTEFALAPERVSEAWPVKAQVLV